MVEQTTLHNILTCVIAVIIFIFQSLNCIIAWVKQYVKHKKKSTTVAPADTTISVVKPNDNDTSESYTEARELIQKHFDIPLIIAEDDPKVNDSIESTERLDSNTASKDEYDQFMDHLIDDSYVARGLGLITATLGREADFYLYSKYGNNFEGIVIELRGRNGETGEITISGKNSVCPIEPKPIPVEYIYDEDRIKVFYTLFTEGIHTLTLSRNNIPICRSPYYISVEKSPANSRSRIRLGTRKCRMVTKFGKSKHSPVETKDSISIVPTSESSKPTVKSNASPMAEETPIRTDVMSIITQFESKNKGFKAKVQKRLTSTTEKSHESDTIYETSAAADKQPKTETSHKKSNTYDSVLNICKLNSRFKITSAKWSNNVTDIDPKNNQRVDNKNTVDIDPGEQNKYTTKLDESVETANDILQKENASPSQQKAMGSVDVLVDKIDNSRSSEVEKHNETSSTDEQLKEPENETVSANIVETRSKIKSTSDEESVRNDVSYADCDDEKPVDSIVNTNELESNPNDHTVQQIIDPTQYSINTLSASTIKKITDSLCEKCSKRVIGILSDLPRDINIKYNGNSNEGHSNFETLLAQPIKININIDNVFKNEINTNTDKSNARLQADNPKKTEHSEDNDIKCVSPSEKESSENNFKELDTNSMNAESVIEQNIHDDEVNKIFDENTVDKVTRPLTENDVETDIEVRRENKLSENETTSQKCSANEEQELINSNIINTNTVHRQENEIESKTSDCDIGENVDDFSEKCAVVLETNDLSTTNDDKNTNDTSGGDESQLIIERKANPEENSNYPSSAVNDTVLTPISVISTNEKCTESDRERRKSTVCEANDRNLETITPKAIDYKLMIEKCFEPVLNSFKNDIVEKIVQLCFDNNFSNENQTEIIANTTNGPNEIKHTDHAKDTESDIENEEVKNNDCEVQIIQEKKEKEKSETILREKKTSDNNFLKQIEKIIEKNITSINTATSAETKLQQIVNAAIHSANEPQEKTSDSDAISEEIISTPPPSPETSGPDLIDTAIGDDQKHVKPKQNNGDQVGKDTRDSSDEKPDISLVDDESKSRITDTAETLSSPIFIENIENKHEIPTAAVETITEENAITVIEPETTFVPPTLNEPETITTEECNAVKIESDVQISKCIENSTELTPVSKPSTSNDCVKKSSSPEKIDDTVENLTSNDNENLIENLDKRDDNTTCILRSSENTENITNESSNTHQIETSNETVGDANNSEKFNIIEDTDTIEIQNSGENENNDATEQPNVAITSNVTEYVTTSEEVQFKETELDQNNACEEENMSVSTIEILGNTRELDTKSQIQKLNDTTTKSENDINTTEVNEISMNKTKEKNYIEHVQNEIDVVNIKYDAISNDITTSVQPKPNTGQHTSTKEVPELNYINITVVAKSRTINIQITTKPEISNENNSEVIKIEEHKHIDVEVKSDISTSLVTEDESKEKQNNLETNTTSDALLNQTDTTKVKSILETPETGSEQAVLPKKTIQNETKNQLENKTLDLDNGSISDEKNISTEMVTDISISKDNQMITVVESQEAKTTIVSEISNSEGLQAVPKENQKLVEEDAPFVSMESKNEQVSPIEESIQTQPENKLENSQGEHTSQITDTETSISASKVDEILSTEETVKLETSTKDIGQNEINNETDIKMIDQETVTITTSKRIGTEMVIDNQEPQVVQETLKPEKHIPELSADSSESEISVDQYLEIEMKPLSIDLNSNESPALSRETTTKEEEIISLSHAIPDIEDKSKEETSIEDTESPTKNELEEPLTVLKDDSKSIDTELKENIQHETTVTQYITEPENLASQISSDTTSTENTKCSLVEETINEDLAIDTSKSDDENKATTENPIQLAEQTTNIISVPNEIDNTLSEDPVIIETGPLSSIPDKIRQKPEVIEEKHPVFSRESDDVQPLSVEENNQNEIHTENIPLTTEIFTEDSSKAVDTETSTNITETQTNEITKTTTSIEPTTILVEVKTLNESKNHSEIKLIDPETVVIEMAEQNGTQTVTESQISKEEQTVIFEKSAKPVSETFIDSSESEMISEESLKTENDQTSATLNTIESSAISIEGKIEVQVNIPPACIIVNDEQTVSAENPIQSETAQNSENEKIDPETLVEEDLSKSDIRPVDLILMESQDASIKDETNVQLQTDSTLIENTQSLKVEKPLNAEIISNNSETEDDKTISNDSIQAMEPITNIIPISTTINETPVEIPPNIETDLISSPLSLEKSTISEELTKEKETNISHTSKISEDTLDLSAEENTQRKTEKLYVEELESEPPNTSINTNSKISETNIQKPIEGETISTEDTAKPENPVLDSVTNCSYSEKQVSVEKHSEKETELKLAKITKQENVKMQLTPTISDDVKSTSTEETIKLRIETPIENELVNQNTNEQNTTENIDTKKEIHLQKLQPESTVSTDETIKFENPASDQISICSSDILLVDKHLTTETELESVTLEQEESMALLSESNVTDHVPKFSVETEIQNTNEKLSESARVDPVPLITEVLKTKTESTLTMTLNSTEFPVIENENEKIARVILTENTQISLVQETMHKENIETDNSKSEDENKATIEDCVQPTIQITNITPVSSATDNALLEAPLISQTESISLLPDEPAQKADLKERKDPLIPSASEEVKSILIEEKNQNEIHTENILLNTETSTEDSSKAVDTETSIIITEIQDNEITTTEKSVEPSTSLTEDINKDSENKLMDSESAVIETKKQVDSQTATEDRVSQNEQTLQTEESLKPTPDIFFNSNEFEIIPGQEMLKKEIDSSSMNLKSIESSDKPIESEIEKEVDIPSACIITDDEQTFSIENTLQNSAASKTENEKAVLMTKCLVVEPLKVVLIPETLEVTESPNLPVEDKLEDEVNASDFSLIIADNVQSISVEDTIQSETEAQLKNETVDSDSIITNTLMIVQATVATDNFETETEECIKQEKTVTDITPTLSESDIDSEGMSLKIDNIGLSIKPNELPNLSEEKLNKEEEHISLISATSEDTQSVFVEETIQKETECLSKNELVETKSAVIDVPKNSDIETESCIQKSKHEEPLLLENKIVITEKFVESGIQVSDTISNSNCPDKAPVKEILKTETKESSILHLEELSSTSTVNTEKKEIEIQHTTIVIKNEQKSSIDKIIQNESDPKPENEILNPVANVIDTLTNISSRITTDNLKSEDDNKETKANIPDSNYVQTLTTEKSLELKNVSTEIVSTKSTSDTFQDKNILKTQTEPTSMPSNSKEFQVASIINTNEEKGTTEVSSTVSENVQILSNEENLISENQESESFPVSDETDDTKHTFKIEASLLSTNSDSEKSPALSKETVKKDEEVISLDREIPDISVEETITEVTETPIDYESVESKTILIDDSKSIDTELEENTKYEKSITKDTKEPENSTSEVDISVLSGTSSIENTKCSLVEETIHNDMEINESNLEDENKATTEDSIQLAEQNTNIIPVPSDIDNTLSENSVITETEPLSSIPDEIGQKPEVVEEKHPVVPGESDDVQPLSVEENNQNEIHTENIPLTTEIFTEDSSKAIDTETSTNITETQTNEITETTTSVEPTITLVEVKTLNESKNHSEIKLIDSETVVIEIAEQNGTQTVTENQISKEEQTVIAEESAKPVSETLIIDSNESEMISKESLKTENDKTSVTLNTIESPAISIEGKIEVEVNIPSACIINVQSDDAQPLSLQDEIQHETDPLTDNQVIDSETTSINISTNIHTDVAIGILNSNDVKHKSSEEYVRPEKPGEFSISGTSGGTFVETANEPVVALLNADELSTSPVEITQNEEEQIQIKPTVSEELEGISIEETIKIDTEPKINDLVESENIFGEITKQAGAETTVSNQDILQDEQNIITEEIAEKEKPVNNFPSIPNTTLNERPMKTEAEPLSSTLNHEESPDVQNTKEVNEVTPPTTMMSEDLLNTFTEKAKQNEPEIRPENDEVDLINFIRKTLMNINSDLDTDKSNVEDHKIIIEDSKRPATQVTDITPVHIVTNETAIGESSVTEIEPVSVILNSKESLDEPVRKPCVVKEETSMIPSVSEVLQIISVLTTYQNENHPENIAVKEETLQEDSSKTINTDISTNVLVSQDNTTTSTEENLEIQKTSDEKIDSNEDKSGLKIEPLDSELNVTDTLKQADVEIVTDNQLSQFEPVESMKIVVEPVNQSSDSIPIPCVSDVTSVQKTFELESKSLSSTSNSEKTQMTSDIKRDVEEEILSTDIAFDDTQISSVEETIRIATTPQLQQEQVIDPETMEVNTNTNIHTEVITDTSNSNKLTTLSMEKSTQLEKPITDTIKMFNDPVPDVLLKTKAETASVTFVSTELPSEPLENTEKIEEEFIQNGSVNSESNQVFSKKRILYTSISSNTDTENDTQVSEDEQIVATEETVGSEEQVSDSNSISRDCGEPLLEASLITEKEPLSKFENISVTQLTKENNEETQVSPSAQIIKSSDNLIKNLVHEKTENQFVSSVLNDSSVVSINDVKSTDQEVASAVSQNYTVSAEVHESANFETEIVKDITLMSVDETSIKVQELNNIKILPSTISVLPDDSRVVLSGDPFEDSKITSCETPTLSSTVISEEKQLPLDKTHESNPSNPSDISSTSGDKESNIEIDTSSEAQESADTTVLPVIKIKKIKIETMTPALDETNFVVENPVDEESIDNQKSSCSEKPDTAKSNSGSYSECGESSKKFLSDIENTSREKSYGIQKLEMSVQRMKTSDDDYFEKTVVQLEQTEKISMGKNAAESGNSTAIDDKLYTVNESDLNAIVCASSLQEALTLLDTKIKFKFKHNNRKSSSTGNSAIHKPNALTPTSSGSNKNANFTEARKFFKEMEKKSKK